MRPSLVFVLTLAVWAFPEEDDVVVLDDNSFDQAVKEIDFLLVEFYAPWCGHCQKLAPEYAKTAQVLKTKSSPIRLAKVDATVNQFLSSRFEVTSFPTLKFFHYGSPREYDGGRVEEEITYWLQEAIKSRLTRLDTEDDMQKTLDEKGTMAVLFAKEGSEAVHAAEIAAIVTQSNDYYLVPSPDVAHTPASLVVYNLKEDTQFTFAGPWTDQNIAEFVKDSKLPLIMDYSRTALEYAVQKHNPVIFVFRRDDHSDEIFNTLLEVAKMEKNEIRFCYAKLDDEDHNRLADFLGLLDEGETTAVLFDTKPKTPKKYKYTESSLDELSIRVFIEKWKKELLTPFYKSEKEPEEQGTILQLTADNYDTMIKKSESQGLMVFFYTQWCLRCQEIDLEQILREFNGRFSVGKIDVMKNEFSWMDSPVYPGVYWYQNDLAPLIYNGNFSMESIVEWIRSECLKEEQKGESQEAAPTGTQEEPATGTQGEPQTGTQGEATEERRTDL